ncbi:MAG: hypothetical protein KatS3mg002_1485 [Candidatus Woesearchaeota archaeon]|nr:MAG: hypothetical protein KatS3mg002_1485 [Candidatus Woesearchaeota archaeon]
MIKRVLKSSLFKASGTYTLFSIFNSAIPFFLIPILTRYLSPEEYGIVAMFSLLLSIIGLFTGLSVYGAINRVYFENDINFKEYVANCIYILVFSSLLTFIIVYVIRNYLSHLTNIPESWVLISVLISFFQILILSNLAIYQATLNAKKYGYIQLGQGLLNATLTIIFIVFLKMKWEGRLLAQVLSIFIFGIFSFFVIAKLWSEWKLNIKYIKHALKFGIPLIPHTIGGMLMVMTDRFIINNMIGTKEVGIYTAGLQIGMIIGLLADSFNKAWAPWLINKLNENTYETKIKIVKFTYLYFGAIIVLALVIGFSAPFIVKIMFGKNYYDAKEIIIWISLGNAFDGMYFMVVNYIFYVYKTHILAWVTFFFWYN